jgi:hypothetical protein
MPHPWRSPAVHRHTEVVPELLDAGAQVDAVRDGFTPC